MNNINEFIAIRAQYISASNKEEKLLAIEAMGLLFMNNDSNPTSVKKDFTKRWKMSELSTNDIYGVDKKYSDMRFLRFPLMAFHIAYHNGTPGATKNQRGFINGKMTKAHAEKIYQMIENPEYYKFGILIANYNSETGCIDIMDGASRLLALAILLGNVSPLIGSFTDLTEDLKRDIFLTQGKNRRTITAIDNFFVAAGSGVAKDEASKILYEIGSEYGITFFPDYNITHNCTSVNCMVNCAKHYREEGVRWVFDIIKDAGYDVYLHTYRQHFLSCMVYAYGMLGAAKVKNPRKVLLQDLIAKKDPDTFEGLARPDIYPEYTTKGRNGEGPMKVYILKLFNIQ